MSAASLTQAMGSAAVVLVTLAVGYLGQLVARGDTPFTRYYRQYSARLDRSLRLLFLARSGRRVASIQLVLIAGLSVLGAFFDAGNAFGAAALVAVGPTAYLARARAGHIRLLEAQTDALLSALANCLKTVPSPAAAMTHIASVLPSPMRLEVDRVLKEMRVGSTLEQALLNLASRLRSAELDAALSALLIGLQVGGNLPRVLDATADTIREMQRLEGVVRTKTSDGRAQLWVLALFPFVISVAFGLLDPDYFTPLRDTLVGTLVAIVAFAFWIAGLALARKIVKVDI